MKDDDGFHEGDVAFDWGFRQPIPKLEGRRALSIDLKRELAQLERAFVQGRGVVLKIRNGAEDEPTLRELDTWIRKARRLGKRVEIAINNKVMSGRGRGVRG